MKSTSIQRSHIDDRFLESTSRESSYDDNRDNAEFTSRVEQTGARKVELQAGICRINNHNITPVEIPFDGVKQSGPGRKNWLVSIGRYAQLKSVYVEMGDVACPY